MRGVDVAELQVDVLKFVASNLAVRFSDLAGRFSQHTEGELKELVSEAAKSGLMKVRDAEAKDPILSITADGSKKADSLRSQVVAVAARVARSF